MEQDGSIVTFRSTATAGGYFRLIAGNLLIILLTLGIGIPWVIVRSFHFVFSNIIIEGRRDVDAILQTEENYRDAMGEDLADMIDIGLVQRFQIFMQQFNVRYYNGRVSTVFNAVLTLMPDHWLIEYGDEFSPVKRSRWELARIVPEQNFTNLHIFRHKEFYEEAIETADEKLIPALEKTYPDKRFFKKRAFNAAGKGNAAIFVLVAGTIGLVVLTYLYLLPFAAEKTAAAIPVSLEKRLGDALYERVLAGYTQNDSLSAAVTAFAQIIRAGDEPYPTRVTVVQESEMNAFALPGGNIVVFDRLLAQIETSEELAALLSHEMAHVHYRHSLMSLFRSLGGYLFISLVLNDVSGIVAVLADNSHMLLNLTYSRELETEADRRAMEVMAGKRIDLAGFVQLFELIGKKDSSIGHTRLLSTHPLTEDRLAAARSKVRLQPGPQEQPELNSQWLKIRQLEK